MKLVDVNVLVYAFREDSVDHFRYRSWLADLVNGDEAYGASEIVLSRFVRVVTHPRIFRTPTPVSVAFDFAKTYRSQPNCVLVAPGPRHWDIFATLCREAKANGNLVADAFLAAMAIESGCEWVTTDRDYRRFPGLRSRHPLAAA